jgi:t-SNARE complex subunit (syntaxin)
MPNLLNDIFAIIKLVESNDLADKRSKEQCLNLKEKLKNKQIEVSSLIKRICDKEAIVAKKLSRINPDQVNLAVKNFQENNIQSESSFQTDDNRRHSLMGFRESKIIVRDIVNQEDYLKNRTIELEEIKKVANQIKDISTSMKYELDEQGKKVELIDKNVEEAKDNIIKAEVEIKEADKISKSYGGNFKCLMFLILLLFIGLILFFLFKFVF